MSPGPASRVVRFAPGEANCLWGTDARYFLLPDGDAAPAMVNARCRHRGGPLHLAASSPDRTQLICPMHGLGTPITALRRAALPMIVRNDELVVMVPETTGPIGPFKVHATPAGR